MWKVTLDVAGAIFSVLGFCIAVSIAIVQHLQLKKLKKIGQDTSETVQEIDREKHKHNLVTRLFCLTEGIDRFRCFFPVKWTGKPLPSICAGDYYALHILQTLLGNENVELNFQNCEDEECEDEDYGSAIFLCTPQANPALKRHADALVLHEGRTKQVPKFFGMEIPCWFANEVTPHHSGGLDLITKKIWISSDQKALRSDAEEEHVRAVAGVRHRPSAPIQTDYAILLRMSLAKKRKLFVIAGIHQYGTWIAAEFLNRLTTKSSFNSIDPKVRAIVGGEHDFAAVIRGDFRTDTLSVERASIHDEFLWRKHKGEWMRLDNERLVKGNGTTKFGNGTTNADRS